MKEKYLPHNRFFTFFIWLLAFSFIFGAGAGAVLKQKSALPTETKNQLPISKKVKTNKLLKKTSAPKKKKDKQTKSSAKPKPVAPQKQDSGACKPTGCNGEICSDEAVMSACVYLPKFSCYKKATCTRLQNGKCGWVKTNSFQSCIFSKQKQSQAPKLNFIPNVKLSMEISSAAFSHNGIIPSKYTCDGQDMNPPLTFSDVPGEAKSLVLLMDDPDVPKSIRPDGIWDHWVVWNISPTAIWIEEGGAPAGLVGKNTGGSQTYSGPCPPDREHRYFFKLYALDTMLDLPGGSSKADVEKAMQSHILAQAELVGRYNRR